MPPTPFSRTVNSRRLPRNSTAYWRAGRRGAWADDCLFGETANRRPTQTKANNASFWPTNCASDFRRAPCDPTRSWPKRRRSSRWANTPRPPTRSRALLNDRAAAKLTDENRRRGPRAPGPVPDPSWQAARRQSNSGRPRRWAERLAANGPGPMRDRRIGLRGRQLRTCARVVRRPGRRARIRPEIRARGLSGLAWCHFQASQLEDASEAFDEVLRLEPAGPRAAEAALMRGRALEHLGADTRRPWQCIAW